jgi:hypothetical protein
MLSNKGEYKMNLRIVVSVILVFFLSGCAALQPVLNSASEADPGAGYVAVLSHQKLITYGYALVLTTSDGKTRYNLPLSDVHTQVTLGKPTTRVIKLPPGTYAVTEWITYMGPATYSWGNHSLLMAQWFEKVAGEKEVITRKKISNEHIKRSFTLEPGQVAHLGSFEMSEKKECLSRYCHQESTQFRLEPLLAAQAQVQRALAADYPHLVNLPVRCLLCSDTVELVTKP